ncbi:MAG: hypothetical protein B6226_01750 [Candidatus Cloacimonetes bacterium 4572_65]|nr:MAG: hypothetical protein B6226_01750 [Candidatus Cloacimonetes bacterium 4572_65]
MLKKIVIYSTLLVVLIIISGEILEHLSAKVYTGENGGLQTYVINNGFDNVIIGNSRAKQHFDPTIIFNGFNETFYNGGVNGYYLNHHSMYIKLLTDNYTPKRILLNINYSDIFEVDKKLPNTIFYPYITDEYIGKQFKKELSLEDYYSLKYVKMSRFIHGFRTVSIVKNVILHPMPSTTGFVKEEVFLDLNKEIVLLPDQDLKVEQDRFNELTSIVEICRKKGIELYLIISPSLKFNERITEEMDKYLQQFASSEVTILNLSKQREQAFLDKNLYADQAHLNYLGAKIISNIIHEKIK